MEITNVSNKKRYCEDKLLEAKESFSTEEEKYVLAAKMSPEIFEISKDQIIKNKKTKEE